MKRMMVRNVARRHRHDLEHLPVPRGGIGGRRDAADDADGDHPHERQTEQQVEGRRAPMNENATASAMSGNRTIVGSIDPSRSRPPATRLDDGEQCRERDHDRRNSGSAASSVPRSSCSSVPCSVNGRPRPEQWKPIPMVVYRLLPRAT